MRQSIAEARSPLNDLIFFADLLWLTENAPIRADLLKYLGTYGPPTFEGRP